MNKLLTLFIIAYCSLLFSCGTRINHYSASHKFPQQKLREDFVLLRNILEKKHPSLYWYTSKDSMDMYFDRYYKAINDSMTEPQFAWQILSPLIQKIHCGHTSVSFSKAYVKWSRGKRLPSFPLFVKVWSDTMAVVGNLNVKDTVFKRGTIIRSINGFSNTQIVNKMFDYLPVDGYAENANYIRVSGNFPYFHRNIFGLSRDYTVGYVDGEGTQKTATVPLFTAKKDTTKKDSLAKASLPKKLPKVNRQLEYRSLLIDSSGKFATLTLNSFTNGHLRSFFRRSFRELKEQHISSLILDIRSNGGGKVGLSTLLTKYISRERFKIADSLYAVTHTLAPYSKYIKGGFLNDVEMFFISRRRADGLFHIGHMERKTFEPKTTNHYNGKVWVLINGPTFSASALFCNAVKGQSGVTLVGEETGGGWYGNDGIMIPDITLPNTHLRVRLPLFRLIQYNHKPVKGMGIPPDVYIGTSYEALVKGYDKKMQVVKAMILAGGEH